MSDFRVFPEGASQSAVATTQALIDQRRATLITYLKMKTDEEDWHGVADAAMDLREHDARYRQR